MGHVKVVQSGKNIEIYEYEKDISPKVRGPRTKRPTLRNTKLRNIRIDNSRRRVKAFRRIITSNLGGTTNPALFTLTMYEILPIKAGYRAFTEFIERLRKDQGRHFKYVAVPEFQERGAVHFHALVWGLPENSVCEGHYVKISGKKRFVHTCPASKKCERATRYYQSLWQAGFLDCVITDGSLKLAGYLSKYMSKSMSDERLHGQKAYVSSRNVLRPVSLSFKTAIIYTKEAWELDLSTVEAVHSREFSTKYLGKGKYRLFQL